ncbi:MAG: hypothetical protein AABN95_08865 [Acidobacteriota bacterium]
MAWNPCTLCDWPRLTVSEDQMCVYFVRVQMVDDRLSYAQRSACRHIITVMHNYYAEWSLTLNVVL